jgi:SAM-dependent methyltransferase
LERRRIRAIGCDLSVGMLSAARPHPRLVNADVTALPFRRHAFDVVLAPHMLYHVADREATAAELRRVLRRSGCCVIVTNGEKHMSSLRALVETAVRKATPTWAMRNPSIDAFSLENGELQLRAAFEGVTCIRPPDVAPVRIADAAIATEYVASVADHYQGETSRPWVEIVEDVGTAVQQEIDEKGCFTVTGDIGAFVCG